MSNMVPDEWQLYVGCWVGKIGGRAYWSLATPNGVIKAEALEVEQTVIDAIIEVVRYLGNELNKVGVDFYTNNPQLKEIISDGTLDALGMRLPHVTLLAPHQLPSGLHLLEDAEAAARELASAVAPVYLLCATDGSRRYRKHGAADTSAKGGFGWVTADGRFGWGPLESTASALESELTAIVRLLNAIDRNQPVEILVDSRDAIFRVCDALDLPSPLPRKKKAEKVHKPGVAAALAKLSVHKGRDIKLTWTKGHVGTPLNEAADQIARLGKEGIRLYGSHARAVEVGQGIVDRFLEAHQEYLVH